MVRKTGQMIRRGSSTWLVHIYVGRDLVTRKCMYLGKPIRRGLRDAQGLCHVYRCWEIRKVNPA